MIMDEEIEDTSSFIYDFSAVSEWEKFIFKIEKVITKWKQSSNSSQKPLPLGAFRNYKWKVTSDRIEFEDDEFTISRYELVTDVPVDSDILDDSGKFCQALVDLSAAHNDFNHFEKHQSNVPPLAAWFGLRDFVVLKPSSEISSENKVKTLLSSINIAIDNSCCEIPLFIQFREFWQNLYLGICESKGLCVKFDTIHLRKFPAQCHYLVGLLDLFKVKVASTVALDTVQISAKLTYALSDWLSASWTQQPPDFDFLQGETIGINAFSTVPFGAVLDPIERMTLFVSWLKLSEDTIVDSQSYSDFDPLLAPFWSVIIEMVDQPSALLFEYYNDFIKMSSCSSTLKQLLDEIYIMESNLNYAGLPMSRQALEASSKVIGEAYLEQGGAICKDLMKSILSFIFMDTKTDDERFIVDENSPFFIGGDTLKAGPVNELIWRLAVVSAQVSQALGEASSLARIWYEFIQEVRYRWENALSISGIGEGFPNSRTCILHQKLQLINICIDRRKTRDEAAMTASTTGDDTTSESSSDEFFECMEDSQEAGGVDTKKRQYYLWDRPVGRLNRFENFKLLETGDQMYIPVTQEPVPKTEDQLEQDSEAMLALGSDPAATKMIAEIMSASMLSDMESFKAANPGAIFDDFIRWYSPRDWIENEEKNEDGSISGHLSARMLIPGNMWLEVWAAAKQVPAKRQKRLFDDTREAEKVLRYLETRKISEIVDLLLPSLTQAVIGKLAEECKDIPELPRLEAQFSRVKACAVRITRERAGAASYGTLSEQIYLVEVAVARVKSVRLKFNFDFKNDGSDEKFVNFLKEMLDGDMAEVPGGSRGRVGIRLCSLFREAGRASIGGRSEETSGPAKKSLPMPSDKSFPAPTEKEYVLRVMAHRPAASSARSLQMMRVILKQNEFRVLGAFTEDVIFT